MATGTWTTKDGVTLEIKDMETNHIQNSMRMLKKGGLKRTIINGAIDMWGVDAWEEEIDLTPKYNELKKELEKRNNVVRIA